MSSFFPPNCGKCGYSHCPTLNCQATSNRTPPKQLETVNHPLEAEVKDGVLTIKIGIETLEWASRPENGGPLKYCKVDSKY